jgi:hypothetical protein
MNDVIYFLCQKKECREVEEHFLSMNEALGFCSSTHTHTHTNQEKVYVTLKNRGKELNKIHSNNFKPFGLNKIFFLSLGDVA